MIQWTKLRQFLAKCTNAIALMLVGAWLLAYYLELTELAHNDVIKNIEQGLLISFLIFNWIGSILRPEQDRPMISTKEFSPRWSGVFVVLLTGGAGSVFLWTSAEVGSDYITSALAALGTVAVAVAVWHFATVHASEIGEARFTK